MMISEAKTRLNESLILGLSDFINCYSNDIMILRASGLFWAYSRTVTKNRFKNYLDGKMEDINVELNSKIFLL